MLYLLHKLWIRCQKDPNEVWAEKAAVHVRVFVNLVHLVALSAARAVEAQNLLARVGGSTERQQMLALAQQTWALAIHAVQVVGLHFFECLGRFDVALVSFCI